MRNGYGISHGDERFLQFAPLGGYLAPMGTGPMTERDQHVSKMMLWLWTSFADIQNPTPSIVPKELNTKLYSTFKGVHAKKRKQPGDFQWIPFTKESKGYVYNVLNCVFLSESYSTAWLRLRVNG